jgi:hypothetical protein
MFWDNMMLMEYFTHKTTLNDGNTIYTKKEGLSPSPEDCRHSGVNIYTINAPEGISTTSGSLVSSN